MDRETNLKHVGERTEPWDIVVIGGGATGAGSALDAAARGYSVLLLEQHDFGKGTSSRSTKLIHGGVRYLRQGNVALVRESLRERGLLIKNAPHVVQRQEFIIPCYRVWEKYFYGFGMKLYDLLAGSDSIGRSQICTRQTVIEKVPEIEQENLNGGVLYFDGQFDDTRLLVDILRTAESRGAAAINYARVTSIKKGEDGKIGGVEFVDLEKGITHNANAKVVINAAGIFSPSVRSMSDPGSVPVITYSQGVHLVFDRRFLSSDSAVMIPKTRDGRVLFCIPWKGAVLMGTTDTPVDSPALEPRAMQKEIDFILKTASEYLATKLGREDIKSIFAGIRPLIKKGNAAKTSSLSRGHELFVDRSGLVTLTGGKWTTYRRMAEDAVDKAAAIAGLDRRGSITAGLSIEPPANCEDDTILHANFAITHGEIVRAVRDEMARTVEDVLARRSRVLLLDADAAIEIAPQAAKIMADELGRGDDWADEQVAAFRELANGYKP